MIKILDKNKSLLNQQTSDGYTALMAACFSKNKLESAEKVKCLLALGADITYLICFFEQLMLKDYLALLKNRWMIISQHATGKKLSRKSHLKAA